MSARLGLGDVDRDPELLLEEGPGGLEDRLLADGFPDERLDHLRGEAVDERGALLCGIGRVLPALPHGIVLHDLLDHGVPVAGLCDRAEDPRASIRGKGDGDRFGRDLDQLLDGLDVLHGPGEELFRELDLPVDEFFIRNRPRGERDEPFARQFLPEVLARERDERGKEPDPGRAERVEFPAPVVPFREPAAVPLQVGLDPEVGFLQGLPGSGSS